MNAKEAREIMEDSISKSKDQDSFWNKFFYWLLMRDVLGDIKKKAKEGEFILKYEMEYRTEEEAQRVAEDLIKEGYGVYIGEITSTHIHNPLDVKKYPYIEIGW